MTIDQLYQINCQQPSAINLHLPTLRKYATHCERVTEFGVQSGLSTTAFLSAWPHFLTSYDIVFDMRLLDLLGVGEFRAAYSTDFTWIFEPTVWRYNLASSLKVEIAQTDLLFIDTVHTYLQLRDELHLHNAKVKKWIILHDTESFGDFSEGWQNIEQPSIEQKQGLKFAIREFLDTHLDWQIKEHSPINNGLTVLERR